MRQFLAFRRPFSSRLLLVVLVVAVRAGEIAGAEPAPPDPGKQLRLLDEALRQAVPELVKSLTDKNVRIRLSALYALEEFEELAAPAAPALVKALADEDPFVRWGAVRVLGRMASPEGSKAAEKAGAFPELARRLSGDSEDVRVTAAAALEHHGVAARSAGPEAARFVNGTEAETCLLAIRILVGVMAEAKVAVPELTKALAAKEAPVRLAAAGALAQYGTDAAPAVEKLRELMTRDADAAVREAAAAAILAVLPKPKLSDK